MAAVVPRRVRMRGFPSAPVHRHACTTLPRARNDAGATTTEYLVIAGVAVLVAMGIAGVMGQGMKTAAGSLVCKVTTALNFGGVACAAGGPTAGGAPNTGGAPAPGPAGLRPPAFPSPPGPGGSGGPASPMGGPTGGPPPGGPAGSGPGTAPGGGSVGTSRGSPPETIAPGFGTNLAVAGALASSGQAGTVAGEGIDMKLAGSPGPGFGGTSARYGNWMGAGWSGGSEMERKVGALPPIDALDALAQEHDFAYAIAEEMGKLYGDAEKFRLLSLADQNGYRAFQNLPHDPRDWNPPPSDFETAARYRDRFPFTMQLLANQHERARQNAAPPSPQQAAALAERGAMTAAELAAEARRRVEAWNRDRGVGMRGRGEWK